MNKSTRRSFLQKSVLVGLGAAAASRDAVFGENEAETALRSEDGELAEVLRSYGRARTMSRAGTQELTAGSRTHRLPAFHLQVEVRDQAAFCRSFDALGRLSDHVLVNGNTVKFARQHRFFVIQNRVPW